jgi:hypothetical protein
LSRPQIVALALAVSALGAGSPITRAADPPNSPATDEASNGSDATKPQKAKFESLPHRQEWELFRQAYSPGRDCPGGTAMMIEVAGTLFFLECQRIQP